MFGPLKVVVGWVEYWCMSICVERSRCVGQLSLRERGAAAVEVALLLAGVAVVGLLGVEAIGGAVGGENIENATAAFSEDPSQVNSDTDDSGPSAANGAGGSSGVFGSTAEAVSRTGLEGEAGFDSNPEVGGYWNTHRAGSRVGEWDVVAGSVDARVSQSSAFNFAVDGHFMDLNGSGAGGHIRRNIDVVPNQPYNLSIDLGENVYGGPSVKSMEVIWNGQVISTVEVDLPRHELRTFTIALPESADGAGSLEFRSLHGGSYGVILDNPTMTLNPT